MLNETKKSLIHTVYPMSLRNLWCSNPLPPVFFFTINHYMYTGEIKLATAHSTPHPQDQQMVHSTLDLSCGFSFSTFWVPQVVTPNPLKVPPLRETNIFGREHSWLEDLIAFLLARHILRGELFFFWGGACIYIYIFFFPSASRAQFERSGPCR